MIKLMMHAISPLQATRLGVIAIILWAIGPTLVLSLQRLPTAQLLMISWSISFGCCALLLTIQGKWATIRQPLSVWLMGVIGLCGTHLSIILALQYSPPASTYLLTTLWPIFLALRRRYLVSAIIGFIGLFILFYEDLYYQPSHLWGYGLAILSSWLWAWYISFSSQRESLPPAMVGMYSGIGALIAALTHGWYESFVILTLNETVMIVAKGLLTSIIAFYAWEIGIKRGNLPLLTLLYYFNPLLGLGLLYGLGFTDVSSYVGLSFTLIILAVWLYFIQAKLHSNA